MDEKNYNILERVVDKLFSGSFSLLIMFGITYCLVIMCCVYMVLKGKIESGDFLILVGGLSGTLMAFWKDYIALKKEEGTKINGDGEKGDKDEKIDPNGGNPATI